MGDSLTSFCLSLPHSLSPSRSSSPSSLHSGTGAELGDTSRGNNDGNDQCVTDGAGDYGNGERALITVLIGGVLNAHGDFGTECSGPNHAYDFLMIAGAKYDCHNAPRHIVVAAGDTFTWQTSRSRWALGWTLCIDDGDDYSYNRDNTERERGLTTGRS